MWIIAIVLAYLILGATLVEMVFVRRYVRWFKHAVIPRPDESELPRVAVILCLRGADPFLSTCLDRLTSQEYPWYEVHVVIDHRTDPSRVRVDDWQEAHPDRQLRVSFLEERSDEAYLKSSAVRQCVGALDDSIDAVVLADGDTIVYRRWLRDMVSPLADRDVGVVTGNRWYDPTLRHWGSVVRFIHNAWSVPPMYFMRITWGGCLAFRREVFHQDFFYERMWKTVTEEQAVLDAARKVGLRLEIHPDVMILNREEYSLNTSFDFVRRQMIWTRLYYTDWWNVLAMVLVNLVIASGAVVAVVCAWMGYPLAAAFLGLALLFQFSAHHFILEWLHAAICRRAGIAQDTSFPLITWPARLRLLAAQPLTLVFFALTLISAWLSQRVRWRGITYDIEPPNAIRMVEYRSFAESTSPVATSP